MSTSYKQQSERDAQFKNQWLGFFSTLDWQQVIKDEGGLEKNPAVGKSNPKRKTFAFAGSYLEVERLPNGKQSVKINGREITSPFRSLYGGPAASGPQVERSQVYEEAKRLSSTLGSLSVQGKDDPTAATRAILRVLSKEKGSLAEFQLVNKHARIQSPDEWTLLCSEFGKQVEARAHVIAKVTGNENVKDSMLGYSIQNNYYNLERKTLEKQFPKILISEGYKPVRLTTITTAKLASVKGQANLIDIAQRLTKKVAVRLPVEGEENKFTFEMPCPFSKPEEKHTLTLNTKGWSSSNPKVGVDDSRDVIGFVKKFRNVDFVEAVKEVADMINLPVTEKDYAQSQDPAYDKGKTRIFLKFVPEADVFKFSRKDVGDNKPTFGRVLDFLEFEKGMDEKKGREHITEFLKNNWLDEEKEAFIEQGILLPGGHEALKKSDSLINQLNSTLSQRVEASASLADELEKVAKHHGVEVDLTSSKDSIEEPEHQNSVDLNR
jgi:hypothetical protein